VFRTADRSTADVANGRWFGRSKPPPRRLVCGPDSGHFLIGLKSTEDGRSKASQERHVRRPDRPKRCERRVIRNTEPMNPVNKNGGKNCAMRMVPTPVHGFPLTNSATGPESCTLAMTDITFDIGPELGAAPVYRELVDRRRTKRVGALRFPTKVFCKGRRICEVMV